MLELSGNSEKEVNQNRGIVRVMEYCQHYRVRKEVMGIDEVTCHMCGRTFANEQDLQQAREEAKKQQK
jgi:hypothetical protein